MSPFWILMELWTMEVVSGDNRSCKTCKAPVKSSPPTNSTPSFLQARCPSCHPTNSVTAMKGNFYNFVSKKIVLLMLCTSLLRRLRCAHEKSRTYPAHWSNPAWTPFPTPPMTIMGSQCNLNPGSECDNQTH